MSIELGLQTAIILLLALVVALVVFAVWFKRTDIPVVTDEEGCDCDEPEVRCSHTPRDAVMKKLAKPRHLSGRRLDNYKYTLHEAVWLCKNSTALDGLETPDQTHLRIVVEAAEKYLLGIPNDRSRS